MNETVHCLPRGSSESTGFGEHPRRLVSESKVSAPRRLSSVAAVSLLATVCALRRRVEDPPSLSAARVQMRWVACDSLEDADRVERLFRLPPRCTRPLLASSGRASLSQHAHGFGDASLPRFGGLGILDQEDQPRPVAVGQAVEEALGSCIESECVREVGRHDHLARLGVELELYSHLVPGGDAGALTSSRTGRRSSYRTAFRGR
jgi:hypothetical protein